MRIATVVWLSYFYKSYYFSELLELGFNSFTEHNCLNLRQNYLPC